MRALFRAIGDAFGFLGRLIKAFFNLIWGFMVIFSFIVNLVLVVVVAVLGILLFNIKNDVADPLLKGLHSSFVGLDEATIDWTIPVRDSVQAEFTLPLETNTVVVLTDNVPLDVIADISGPVSISNARVQLTLPTGLNLPVSLDLDVPVDEEIPVNLDVRAVIPLSDTQLHDPFENLKLTFEPIILALDNLPNNFGEANVFATQLLTGNQPNLFADSDYSNDPWPGFSRSAGYGYDLAADSATLNAPAESVLSAQAAGDGSNVFMTGIVPNGGIPFLDAQIRPELHGEDASPEDLNADAIATLEALQVPSNAFAGNEPGAAPDPAMMTTPMPNDLATNPNAGGDAVGGPTGSDVIVPEAPQPVFTVVPEAGG